jgi:hypothetical protein
MLIIETIISLKYMFLLLDEDNRRRGLYLTDDFQINESLHINRRAGCGCVSDVVAFFTNDDDDESILVTN